MRDLVIKRSEWAHGGEASGLLTELGKKCCLGFLSLACGVKEELIRGLAMPESLLQFHHIPSLPVGMEFLDINHSEVAELLAVVNDVRLGGAVSLHGVSYLIDTEKTREKLLTSIFAEHDWNVTFVD